MSIGGWFSMAVAALACLPAAVAQTTTPAAEPGTAQAFTNRAANVRAGPDRNFPSVTFVLGNTPVTVLGCVASFRWCDVVVGRNRGWIYARYLTLSFDGGKATILDRGPRTGLPELEFSVVPYWEAHYREAPWFRNIAYWQSRWERRAPAPGWRPPRSEERPAQ